MIVATKVKVTPVDDTVVGLGVTVKLVNEFTVHGVVHMKATEQ